MPGRAEPPARRRDGRVALLVMALILVGVAVVVTVVLSQSWPVRAAATAVYIGVLLAAFALRRSRSKTEPART